MNTVGLGGLQDKRAGRKRCQGTVTERGRSGLGSAMARDGDRPEQRTSSSELFLPGPCWGPSGESGQGQAPARSRGLLGLPCVLGPGEDPPQVEVVASPVVSVS